MRHWFNGSARWSIVELDDASEVESLIFLESDWTKQERLVLCDGTLNYRTLGRVARNAVTSNYLESPRASRHCEYCSDLRPGTIHAGRS
jgi:hypothetical protein